MVDESLRPGYRDTLGCTMSHVPITIPVVSVADDLETLLLVTVSAEDLLNVVAWSIAGNIDGVARGAFWYVPLDTDPAGPLPTGEIVEVATGVNFSPPIGRAALPKTYVTGPIAATVDAIVILYHASMDIEL